MGRGVETIGENALYFDVCEMMQDDSWDRYWEWDDLIENLQSNLRKAFPSFTDSDIWAGYPYRENKGILQNDHVIVYISEYCGCGAISVVIADDECPVLADHWLAQIWEHFTKIVGENVDLLTKLGTFSNGESVFEKRG